MKRACLLISVFFLLILVLPATAEETGSDTPIIEIPYEKFVLENGLTLLVHEDPKAPIVAVNVWYHVGSKNEKLGKTGFAHLFEHLMFNGSENYNDDYFKPMSRVGATDMNGTTNFDRTNYFQNVPKTALDMALWMESDRMGHLLGAVDQAKLDEQRGVVQNEVRQGENQPYGKAFRLIVEGTAPEGHPYSWTVGGSLEDLDAATLDDVHEWFKTYYGTANAVLAVAGDVDVEKVKAKVEKYFGDIPAGPPLARPESWKIEREQTIRKSLADRVAQARVYKVWNISERNAADSQYLELAKDVLTGGKTSRLYKRLVYDEQIATDVVGFVWEREIGGLFILWATAQPGGDLAAVEHALDEEMARFLAEGPTEAELERVKTAWRADFVRGIERIGGFGGKSDILAQNEVYAGDPSFHTTIQRRMTEATPGDVQSAAETWLADGQFVLEVHPFPEYETSASEVDRSAGVPEVDEWPEVDFPEVERAELSNGLDVLFVRRDAVPTVLFRLILDAGYAADQFGLPGTANLAMNMLDEGTKSRSALEISDDLAALGAELSASSGLDTSSVSLSALKDNLAASLDLYAEVILEPAFPEGDFGRLKKQQLAAIQREKRSPFQIGLRVFPPLLYGEGHAYSLPFTGSGTEDSLAKLERNDLAEFHATWFKPNHATLLVVGDTTLEEITAELEARFAAWKPGDVPTKNVASREPRDGSRVFLIDRPDSVQTVILAGHLMPPKANPDELAIEAANGVLGGGFTARVNMNLREDKHWSYGAGSLVFDARGPRPFIVYAPVQTDKTKESLQEIQKELEDILGDRPPADDEVARVKDENTLTLPGRWETAQAVLGSLAEMVQYDLPEDHWDTFAGRMLALSTAGVSEVAKKVIRPNGVTWVVVGDRGKIEAGIRELGLGEIRLIDADGRPVGE